jgi:hypothetical protein
MGKAEFQNPLPGLGSGFLSFEAYGHYVQRDFERTLPSFWPSAAERKRFAGSEFVSWQTCRDTLRGFSVAFRVSGHLDLSEQCDFLSQLAGRLWHQELFGTDDYDDPLFSVDGR